MVALEIFKSRWAFTPKQRWPATLTLIKSRSVVENPSHPLSRHCALCYSGKKVSVASWALLSWKSWPWRQGPPCLPRQATCTLLHGKSQTKSVRGLADHTSLWWHPRVQCPSLIPSVSSEKGGKSRENEVAVQSGKQKSFRALLRGRAWAHCPSMICKLLPASGPATRGKIIFGLNSLMWRRKNWVQERLQVKATGMSFETWTQLSNQPSHRHSCAKLLRKLSAQQSIMQDGLEGTLKIMLFQPFCHRQGHLPLSVLVKALSSLVLTVSQEGSTPWAGRWEGSTVRVLSCV